MKTVKFVTCLLAAAALLAVSCNKEKTPAEKTNPFAGEKMVFTLSVNSVGGDNVSIKVKHNGKSKLSWYGFVTEDLDSSLAELVENNAYGLEAKELSVGANKNLEFKDLEVETDYRFVAFGAAVEDDGTVWTYGTPAELSFKTSKDLNVIFSATEPVVERNKVTFTLSYDVEEDDFFTWYGFLTTDIGSTAANVIKATVKNIPASDLKTGTNVEISLTDLDFSKSYRYIVTGLLPDGTTYGTPADVMFQIGEKYYLESAWSLSHSIDETSYPGYPHKFTNTVAAGSSAGKYFITLYPEAEIEDTSDLPAFIDEILPDEVEYLEYQAEQNNKTLSDYITAATGSDWYKLSYRNFYVFAIGLTDEGEATGAYAYMTYYNEPDDAAKEAYNKWLGNWFLGDDLIPVTVVENELCVNYRVQGYGSAIVPEGFLANFSASGNSLVFYNQTVTVDDEGYEVQWNGLVNYQGNNVVVSGGAYTIGTATMSADGKSADVAAGAVSLTVGGDYTVVGMNYYAHKGNSVYSYNATPDPIMVPTTMIRPAETGSEAYNKWLGTWEIQRPEYTEGTDDEDGVPTGNMITDEWVIEQNFADISYTISGIDGYAGESVTATFDSATGGITVSEQAMGSFEQNEVTYRKYLMGLFNSNTKIWGGSEKIFSGAINSDGTATLTGLEFTGESTTGVITATFTGMELFVTNADGTSFVDMGADHWGEFYTFPCNISKKAASGTSIKMRKTSGKQVSLKRAKHLFRPFSSADLIYGHRRGRSSSMAAASVRAEAKAVK